MSQNYEAQGKIHSIGATTEYGNNGFTKREFVLKLTGENESPAYPNYIALELIKDKCALIDGYSVGDELKVQFNLSGRLWQSGDKPEKCFTSLQCWRISPATNEVSTNSANSQPLETHFTDDSFDDDIPF